MENQIDFNLVKSLVSFEMVIVHYGIASLTRKGDEVRLKCPFHQGKTENSLSINLAKDSFYCFGCKVRGNILDFVGKQEKCSVKDAALKLYKWFDLDKESVVGESNQFVGEQERKGSIQRNDPSVILLIANIETQLTKLKSILLSQ